MIASVVFLILIAMAAFIPAQNDTWWQLAAGRQMVEQGRIALTEEFSWTARGAYWPNHEWLSQLVFFLVYSVGGMPLLTGLGMSLVVGALALIWTQMSGPPLLRALVFVTMISAFVSEWSLRPKLFTFFLVALSLRLLTTGRHWWMPVILLLWANLHGAFPAGLILMAAAMLQAALHDRHQLWRLTATFGLSVLATACTPLGFSLYKAVLATVKRPDVRLLHEWQPVGAEWWHWTFLLTLPALLALVVRLRGALSPQERILAYTCLLLLPLALRYSRNIPLFMIAATPLMTMLLSRVPSVVVLLRSSGVRSPVFSRISAAAALVVTIVVASAWVARVPALAWDPISPEMVRAVESCAPPMYNHYDAGGYLIWFTPRQPVYIDGRNLPYSEEFSLEHFRIEQSGHYAPLFDSRGIRCAVLPRTSPVRTALGRDGWQTRHDDGQWVVMVRQ